VHSLLEFFSDLLYHTINNRLLSFTYVCTCSTMCNGYTRRISTTHCGVLVVQSFFSLGFYFVYVPPPTETGVCQDLTSVLWFFCSNNTFLLLPHSATTLLLSVLYLWTSSLRYCFNFSLIVVLDWSSFVFLFTFTDSFDCSIKIPANRTHILFWLTAIIVGFFPVAFLRLPTCAWLAHNLDSFFFSWFLPLRLADPPGVADPAYLWSIVSLRVLTFCGWLLPSLD